MDGMLGRLQSRGAELSALIDRIGREIAERTANGADLPKLRTLRERRREAVDEASEVGDALALLREREVQGAEECRHRAQVEALATARTDAEKLLEAAGAVDAALDNLRAAHERLRLAALDLGRSTRLAGRSDSGRLANALSPAIRWAAWHWAPGFAKDAQVPRAEVHRRRDLRTSAARVIPDLEG